MSLNYKEYFEGKRITVMGLGLLGRGVNVVKFLSEMGAILTVTDLKTEDDLKDSLDQLEGLSGVNFVLGEHRLGDFKDKDLIIKAAGVPLDSPYTAEAEKNNIPVKMDASLFLELSGVFTIGVTGTRGKSTVAQLIYEILKEAKKEVFLAGNVRGMATLPLLDKVSPESVVVLELDSWQLQGFGSEEISLNISVFASFMPDHMNYYKDSMEDYFADKANIYQFQKEDDVLITTEDVLKIIEGKHFPQKARRVISKKEDVSGLESALIGEHNKVNVGLAVDVVKELGVSEDIIKKAVVSFRGVEGRLQFLREKNGIRIYNDNNATSPEATIAALQSMGEEKNVIWIGGGADKNFEYKNLTEEVLKKVKVAILFEGAATDKMVELLGNHMVYHMVNDMEEAIRTAKENSGAGDVILFSPGAASFGLFKNEFDRGDQFLEEINKI